MRLGGNRRWVPLFGIDDFHEHLNRQKADMQFTKDIEENGKITFLDCLVTRDNNKLKTTIYRKPTHTDRLRDQSSYNPTKVILALCGKPYVGLSPIKPSQRPQYTKDTDVLANEFNRFFISVGQEAAKKSTELANHYGLQ